MTNLDIPAARALIDIVFDGPPAPETGRFVEVEDPARHSIGDVGEWIHRDDGYWVLRIPDPRDLLDALKAERARAEAMREALDAVCLDLHVALTRHMILPTDIDRRVVKAIYDRAAAALSSAGEGEADRG